MNHLLHRRSLAAAARVRRRRNARPLLARIPGRTRAQGSSRARRMDMRRHGNVCVKHNSVIDCLWSDYKNIIICR